MVADKDIVNMFNVNNDSQEEFITVKMGTTAEDAFKDKTLPKFWIAMVFGIPKFTRTAIGRLMPFPSIYLYVAGSFALLEIKSKIRNKLAVGPDLKRALSTTMPCVDRLVTKMQHHCLVEANF